MVFGIAKPLQYPCTKEQRKHINELNLKSILGCHAINDDAGCYSYRATHWLDKTMEAPRFFEILDRCIDEAERGYQKVVE